MIHPNQYLKDPILNRVVGNYDTKFAQTSREKIMTSTHSKESREPDYEEDKDQLDEEQEEKTGERK